MLFNIADSSAILQAEGFLLYLYWPLIVTLLRVYLSKLLNFLNKPLFWGLVNWLLGILAGYGAKMSTFGHFVW